MSDYFKVEHVGGGALVESHVSDNGLFFKMLLALAKSDPTIAAAMIVAVMAYATDQNMPLGEFYSQFKQGKRPIIPNPNDN